MLKSRERLTSWNIHGYHNITTAVSEHNGLQTAEVRDKIGQVLSADV